jgi:hypothetical protein
VAPDLAEDRGRGEAGELEAPLGLEAVDGLDQADRADLDQIVEGLPAVGVAAREAADQGEVLDDETLALGGVEGAARGQGTTSGTDGRATTHHARPPDGTNGSPAPDSLGDG